LGRAATASYRLLQPFREKRIRLVRQLLGRNFSDEGCTEAVSLNLIGLAYAIHTHNLVANKPKILCTTKIRQLRPTAEDFRLSIDLLIEEIALARSLRECAAAALFGISMAKVGLCEAGQDGLERVSGAPFVEPVDLDDFVVDMSAKRWNEIAFIGNCYRISIQDLRESDWYDQGIVDQLQPDDKSQVNEGGDDKITSLSIGTAGDHDPYFETVELVDLWVPRDRIVVTVPRVGMDRVLRTIEWTGPSVGPYRKLIFLEAPGQLMPLPPAAQWYDLHVQANALYRKVVRQGLRQKTIVGAVAEGVDDADNVIKASDGDVIRLRQPGGMSEISFGGPNQPVLAMAVTARDLFSYFAGNLESYGGLGPQADTLGQDQIIHETASRQLKDMQDRMVEFTSEVVRDLAFWRWHDPLRVDRLNKRIEGVDFDFPTEFGPHTRAGMLFDYQFEIAPYSMQHRTPAMRLQTLMQFLNGFLIPAAGLMQSQGLSLDAKEIIKTIAAYSDMHEINDFVKFSPAAGGTSLDEQSQKAPPSITHESSHRTYERINRPGRTNRGADYALAQTMLGGGVQGSEAASVAGMQE
jgi:hypothetical protein